MPNFVDAETPKSCLKTEIYSFHFIKDFSASVYSDARRTRGQGPIFVMFDFKASPAIAIKCFDRLIPIKCSARLIPTFPFLSSSLYTHQ
uniref:Uncharacterized protein n=1 Tax=Manihot esculenta TaxID=3983 RepID=A0A2C9UHX8_MANES